MMDKFSDPLETLIDFAWASGADRFWVNNAKDELKRLRKTIDELNVKLAQPVAYARINSSGDLFGLNLRNNPYNDQSTVVPLYRLK